MSNAVTHHSRSIAKQTLLGVIAALALVAGASMALAADGDGTEEPATTCPETGDTTTTAVEDGAASEADVETDVETDDECAPTSTTVAEDPESDEDDGDEGDDGESEETDEEDEADDGTDDDGEEVADVTDGDDEFRNHGEAVSKAAREDCEPGPGHGACVSEVARSNAGKHGSEEGDDEVDDESDDDIDDSSESTESTRTEKPAKAAKGNGASKGKGHKG